MPAYLFENPETGQIVEVKQDMDSDHSYEENGVKYNRIITVANAAIDSKIDPFSSKDFVAKTASKRETLGDIFDRSKEASEKRKEIIGKDTVKENYYSDWSKARCGRENPEARRERILGKLKSNKNIDVE